MTPPKSVYLVGGNGYIGQRLATFLKIHGWNPVVVDPCILSGPTPFIAGRLIRHPIQQAITDGKIPPNVPVVYLASFHDFPGYNSLDLIQKRQWEEEADTLMVNIPNDLCVGRKLIYFSSMRALTHRDTFYGNLKGIAESLLFKRASIIRPGTVYGHLRREPGYYNRTITVPNQWIVRGKKPDLNWRAYVVDMDRVLNMVLEMLYAPMGEVRHAIHPQHPLTRKELTAYIKPCPMDLVREPHPALLTAKYYGLPIPEELK